MKWLKLFEEFRKEYEFDKLILKTKNNDDYIIHINKELSNFSKEDIEIIWEFFEPIYKSYNLSLDLRTDNDYINNNSVIIDVAKNAYLEIYITNEDFEDMETDLKSFASGLYNMGIITHINKYNIIIEEDTDGVEIDLTFFKK